MRILLYADTYNDKVSINSAYVDFLQQFGEVLLVMPSNDLKFYTEFGDVLALPGGADVDPMRYGEYPKSVSRTNPHFEYLDKHLLMPWLETGKPIVAICRGLQTLNVALGGSLYQHIEGHVQVADRNKCEQKLYTDIEGYHIHKINSFHHQAIKVLAPDFDVLGWTTAYKRCPSLHDRVRPEGRHIYEEVTEHGQKKIKMEEIIYKGNKEINYYHSFPEIIKHRTRPYIAFQYHPEEFFCPLATELICETLDLKYEPETEKIKQA